MLVGPNCNLYCSVIRTNVVLHAGDWSYQFRPCKRPRTGLIERATKEQHVIFMSWDAMLGKLTQDSFDWLDLFECPIAGIGEIMIILDNFLKFWRLDIYTYGAISGGLRNTAAHILKSALIASNVTGMWKPIVCCCR